VAHELVGEHARDVVEDERDGCVLEDGAVALLDHVAEILIIALADFRHVRVEARLPRAVAETTRDLAQHFRSALPI